MLHVVVTIPGVETTSDLHPTMPIATVNIALIYDQWYHTQYITGDTQSK